MGKVKFANRPVINSAVAMLEPKLHEKNLNILLVDADEQNNAARGAFLKGLGAQLFIARDAVTAITLIIEQADTAAAIDIAVIACQLPGMTGHELVATLKTIPFAKTVKLILVGADAKPGEADCFINELVEKYDLLRAIAAVWGVAEEPESRLAIEASITEFMLETEISEQEALEIFADFRNYLPALLAKLTAALAQNDFEQLRKLAHQLKGSSGNLRVSAIYSLTAALETAAAGQDQRECTALLAKLQEILLRF